MENDAVWRLKKELTKKMVEKQRRSDMLVIYQKWCKSCGICHDLCPQGTFEADHEGKVYIKYPETCTGLQNLRTSLSGFCHPRHRRTSQSTESGAKR